MIRDPVIIAGCPRSGTTLLFSLLSEVTALWSTGGENGRLIESVHHPAQKNWESGALDASDLTASSRSYLLREFELRSAPGSAWRRSNRLRQLVRGRRLWRALKSRQPRADLAGRVASRSPDAALGLIRAAIRAKNRLLAPFRTRTVRLLDKTPENCLRLPFLTALFPDARIIYLTRHGPDNVSSLMEGWRHPHLFHGYEAPIRLSILGNGQENRWAFTLIPGWRDLASSPLEEVCAWQWVRCNEAILEHRDRNDVPYLTVKFEELVAQPAATFEAILGFLQIDDGPKIAGDTLLPVVNAITPPLPDKWKRQNPDAIHRVRPLLEATMQRLGYAQL